QIYADESRTIQILLNVLHNAIKFTEKGDINVTATTDKEQKMAFIHIKDSGKGMDSNVAKEIFLPYTKTETHDCIGLGLKITKELVENHGGEISVNSNLNKGSKFTFSLPLSTENENSNNINIERAILTEENED